MTTYGEFRKRLIVPDDLEKIEEICNTVHFDVGLHNLKLYYETSPQSWSVLVDKDDQIAAIAAQNIIGDNIIYGYITVVVEKYRSKGLTRMIMPNYITEPLMGSSGNLSIVRATMHGLHWLEKRHGFYGLVQKRTTDRLIVPQIDGIRIEMVNRESIDSLLEYDKSISLIDRKNFLKQWSCPSSDDGEIYGRSVVAIDESDNRCLGYGTMRLFSYYHGIQPLYADNDQIATCLMSALAKWCLRGDVNLYMPAMADKRAAFEFCTKLGMTITGTEMRNCSEKMLAFAKSLPVRKVYSVHEYYPV